MRRQPLVHLPFLCAVLASGCAMPLGEASEELDLEPRRDLYQATSRRELRAASADLFSINRDDIVERPDGDYDLLSVPFTIVDESPNGRRLCPDASFYGQPRLYAGATAILVGDDLAVTAGHAMQNQAACDGRALIFDHAIAVPPASEETHPILDAEQVYFCRELVATGYLPPLWQDWSLIRLDRSVPEDRIPLKVRRTGTLAPGSPVLLVGHPHRLPLKLESTTGTDTGTGSAVFGPGVIAIGSSGSMVYDTTFGRVEGLVVSGSLPPPIYDPALDCYRECVTCGGTYSATGAGLFAAPIPVVGLEVAPVGPSVHYGPPGGPFSDPRVDYVLSAGAAGRPTELTVTPPADGLIDLLPSLSRPRLPPGSSQVVRAQLDEAHAAELPIGAYEPTLQFHDSTYITRDDRVHRVLVGVEGFTAVAASTARRRVLYALANRYLVVQQLEVSTDASWLTLNEGGMLVSVSLPPRDSEAPAVPLIASLAGLRPPPGSEAAITFRSGAVEPWHTVVRHVQWDGESLIALD